MKSLQALLNDVATGKVAPEKALAAIRGTAENGGIKHFARVDLDRRRRCGLPEVIFCPGKQPDQVVRIAATLLEHRQNVLATRAEPVVYEHVRAAMPDAKYHASARCVTVDRFPLPKPKGRVSVVAAGTADLPVAEEAALVANRMGARVVRVYDVGVAGLHRLYPVLPGLRRSRAIVVVAGMEGALPSVVAGLVDRPVVAVPTSVGYGLHFNGLAALLAMLNSCTPGITVVNVDNGFGAGVAAARINAVGNTTRSRA